MKHPELTDEQILEKLCTATQPQQQDDLIAELYYRYNQRIISWLVLKTRDIEQAQELGSQVVEKLVHALRKQAGSQKENPIQQFKSWLYRIAHNVFIDDFQKQKKEKVKVFGDDAVGKPQEESLIDESHELLQIKLNFEYRHVMQELALFLLSDSQREVYLTRYYRQLAEGKRMPVKQVAETLNMTTRMVWTNLKTGKERLEKLISEAFQRNVTLRNEAEVFNQLLLLCNLPFLPTAEAHQTEQESLVPALRLLPTPQTTLLLKKFMEDIALNADEKIVVQKATTSLQKMLEGRRTLEEWLQTTTTQK